MPVYICSNCKASLTSKKAYESGKRVVCPKCKKPFVIKNEEEEKEAAAIEEPEQEEATADEAAEADEEEKPAKKKPKADEDDDAEADEEEEEAPKKKKPKADVDEEEEETPKKKGKKAAAEEAPPPKSTSMMLVVAIGGLLLLTCCCCGGGIGGWFVYDKYFAAPPFQGTWVGIDGPNQVSFLRGGKAYVFVMDVAAGKPRDDVVVEPNATWKQPDDKTLELTLDKMTQRIPWTNSANAKFTFVVSGDTLSLTNLSGDKKETKFKRAPDDK